MAIDARGKPTTTGMMDAKPNVPKAPDLRALSVKQQQKVKPQSQPKPTEVDPIKQQFPDATDMEVEFAKRVSKLTDEDTAALQSVLSPSVRTALGKIIPEFSEAMEAYGTDEPNVVIPLSTAQNFASKRYGGENSLRTFLSDMLEEPQQEQPMEQQQTTVPPSQPQGIMASPQNMEQV